MINNSDLREAFSIYVCSRTFYNRTETLSDSCDAKRNAQNDINSAVFNSIMSPTKKSCKNKWSTQVKTYCSGDTYGTRFLETTTEGAVQWFAHKNHHFQSEKAHHVLLYAFYQFVLLICSKFNVCTEKMPPISHLRFSLEIKMLFTSLAGPPKRYD